MSNLEKEMFYNKDYVDGCEALIQKKNFEKAIILFDRCIRKNTNIPEYWKKLGVAFFLKRKLHEAKNCFLKSIKLFPNDYLSLMNLGVINYELSNFQNSIFYFQNSIKVNNNDSRSKIYLSLINLTLGFSQKNIAFYENNRDKSKLKMICKELNTPELELQNFFTKERKKILVFNSEGFGDHLMFFRYINRLNKFNFDITLILDKSIIEIFKNTNIRNVNFKSSLNLDDRFDFVVDALSFPYFFNKKYKKIPDPVSFKKQFINKGLPDGIKQKFCQSKKKIGVSWSGNNAMPRNNIRSIPLKNFSKIFQKYQNIHFFVLQININKDEEKELRKYKNVTNCQSFLKNFSDTIKIASEMDEIITICTSLVHISGSLKKPTKLLLSKVPDWRWGLTKAKNHWYQNIQILRQKNLDNWDEIIDKI